MDTIEQLLQRGQDAQGGGVAQALLSAPEAERIIGQLAPLTIEEVGGPKWHAQHDWIERLNLQAHYNAQTHSDEFVVELLVSLDKLHVLVHDLLLIEAWKEFVYPLLQSHLAEAVDSVATYLLLYHEVTVANLLQVALYHSHAAESLSEDYALEMADWCYRKLTRLNAEGHQLAEPRDRTTEELLAMSRLDEQEEKRLEVEFSVMMCSLAILRYITDSLPRMPMGALSRVVSTNDTLMGLLPLLDRPPWVRTRVPTTRTGGSGSVNNKGAGGGGGGRPVLEKWAGNRWVAVPPVDRLKITQTDGQVWLAVTNLLVEPRCRAKYGMDEFRRERILGLKRHLNELMFDQLPVLKDLQRVLDELALGVLPNQSGAGSKSAALILEAVPVVREAMLRGRNWRLVAERAKQEHFGKDAARMARERMEAMVKHLDFLCELEPQPKSGAAAGGDGAAAAAAPAPPPPVKVSTWRKVHDSGVFETWYDFAMEVDESRPPEPVEVAAANAGTPGSSSSGNGASGAVTAVHGLRYRLRPLDVDSTRPLPANGKAVVRWGDELTAEALIQLPELPTRSSEEGAAVLWVTVGLLAVDGLVLQVKLKKAPKPKERDRVAGVWYAYHPVAGALTVLRDHAAITTATTISSNRQKPQDAKTQLAVKSGSTAAPGPSSSSASSSAALTAAGGEKGGSSGRPLVQVISEPAGGKAPTKKPSASASAAVPSSAGTASGAVESSGGVARQGGESADDSSGGAATSRGSVPTAGRSNPAERLAAKPLKAAALPVASMVEPGETQDTGAVVISCDEGNASAFAAVGVEPGTRKPVEAVTAAPAAVPKPPNPLTPPPPPPPPPLLPPAAQAAAAAEAVGGTETERQEDFPGLDDPE